jgi:hypothetical protein
MVMGEMGTDGMAVMAMMCTATTGMGTIHGTILSASTDRNSNSGREKSPPTGTDANAVTGNRRRTRGGVHKNRNRNRNRNNHLNNHHVATLLAMKTSTEDHDVIPQTPALQNPKR